jgi:hypothetical protein
MILKQQKISRRPDITDTKLAELYNKGFNYREIAHFFNTESKIILAKLNKMGIEPEKLSLDLRQDIDDSIIVKLYNEGLSSCQIGEQFHITSTTIQNRLKRNGVILRDFSKDIPISDLKRLYVTDKKSCREIADMYDTTHTLIKRHLNEAGVSLRSKVEANAKLIRINTCIICGTVFRPHDATTPSPNYGRKTCSPACRSVLLSTILFENPHNFKDGSSQSHYQNVARKTKEMKCEICNKTVEERLDTHHSDKNHANNDFDNTHIWCVFCHAKYHYITENRGLRGWNPHTPKLKKFRSRLDELKIEYSIPL